MNLRQAILEAHDLPEESVEVPEWGVTLLMRGLTGGQRAKIVDQVIGHKGGGSMSTVYPELIVMSARDPETGDAVFELPDRDTLMEKSGQVLDRLAIVVLRLSGLTPAVTEEVGNA